MYKITGLSKKLLWAALRKMGPKYSNSPREWNPELPTIGYCYVVSEFLYHFVAPKNSQPMRLQNSPAGSHWFLNWPVDEKMEIVDLTSDQIEEDFDYIEAKERSFITKTPNKRTKLLAQYLGYLD